VIALYIIVGIVLFFIAVLSIPVFINIEYTDLVRCSISWLFIKIQLYPKADKKPEENKEKEPEPEKEKKEEPKEDKPKEKKENFLVTFYHNEGVDGVIQLLRNFISYLNKFSKGFIKSIIIKNLRINVSVTEADAAQTAIKYGQICAGFYPSLGFICSNMKVKDYKVNIFADYIGEKTSCEFTAGVGIVPRAVINAGIAFVFRLIGQLLHIVFSNIKFANKNTKGGQNQ